MKPALTVTSGQVILRSIRPYGSARSALRRNPDCPARAKQRASKVGPSRTSPVAIGSAPSSAAMTILVRITIGSPRGAVVEAELVSAASSSSPLRAQEEPTHQHQHHCSAHDRS